MAELKARGELPSTPEGLAVELAMRAGDLVTSSGASVQDTIVLMRKICHAYGLDRVQIDVTYHVILTSYYPGEGMPPLTVARTVTPTVSNLSKVMEVNDLVVKIEQGMSIARAMKEFDRLRKADPPYPGWVAALASGGISMSVQLFYTLDIKILILALLTGILVNRFISLLRSWGLPIFFQQLFGGWLVIAIAASFTWLNEHPNLEFFGYVSPTTIAVGCIFQLVVGARFVAGVQDAIDGHYVTATARILEVVIMNVGLVVGLLTALEFARRFGIAVYLRTSVLTPGGPIEQLVAATLTAVLWGIAAYSNARTLIVMACVTLLARATYLLVMVFDTSLVAFDTSIVVASFAGPMVAAFVTVIVVRWRWSAPTFGVLNAMGIPFVPGMLLYLGLLQTVGTHSVEPDPSSGFATVGMAIAIALAISAGASLGAFLGRPSQERHLLTQKTWTQMMTKEITQPAGGTLSHVTGEETPEEVSKDRG
jgi:uncharacterized membrane protein YjjP (DUF1212 family)